MKLVTSSSQEGPENHARMERVEGFLRELDTALLPALVSYISLTQPHSFPSAEWWAEANRRHQEHGESYDQVMSLVEDLRQELDIHLIDLQPVILQALETQGVPIESAKKLDSPLRLLNIAISEDETELYIDLLDLPEDAKSALRECYRALGEQQHEFPGMVAAASLVFTEQIKGNGFRQWQREYLDRVLGEFEAEHGAEPLKMEVEVPVHSGDQIVNFAVSSLADLRAELDQFYRETTPNESDAADFLSSMLVSVPEQVRNDFLAVVGIQTITEDRIVFQDGPEEGKIARENQLRQMTQYLSPRFRQFVAANPFVNGYLHTIGRIYGHHEDTTTKADVVREERSLLRALHSDLTSDEAFKDKGLRLHRLCLERLERASEVTVGDTTNIRYDFLRRRLDMAQRILLRSGPLTKDDRRRFVALLGGSLEP